MRRDRVSRKIGPARSRMGVGAQRAELRSPEGSDPLMIATRRIPIPAMCFGEESVARSADPGTTPQHGLMLRMAGPGGHRFAQQATARSSFATRDGAT